MRNDARTRYTEQVLKNALLKLLETKPINKITVKEVCQSAQLNRATFYTHYTDCYDLLTQMENDLINDYVASLKYLSSFDVTDLVEAVYNMIEKNIGICELLVFKNTNVSLIKKMINITHDEGIANWKKHLKKANDEQLEMLFACLANGLASVVVEGYGKYKRNELIAFVNTMVNSSLAAYM